MGEANERNQLEQSDCDETKLVCQVQLYREHWVGFSSRSNEHLVVLPGGGPALRVRTVRAWPSSEKWSADAVAEIRAIPERPNPHNAKLKFVEAERNTEGTQFGAKPKHEAAEAKPERESAEHQEGQRVKDIRDFRIIDAHLQEFG